MPDPQTLEGHYRHTRRKELPGKLPRRRLLERDHRAEYF